MKYLFILTTILMSSEAIIAQPSEADIKKQLTNAGTKSIRFTKSTGTRQWNRDIGNWEYVRGVEVTRNSEYPGIDLIVSGDAVYQYTGSGGYSYWKFRTTDNQYSGIPNPTAAEIQDYISRDWQKFYGYYFTVITRLLSPPALADPPKWTWHSPNSVEFRMKLKFDFIATGIEVQTLECIWNVRLYRDDPKSPWKNMLALRSEEAADLNVVDKKQYTAAQINDLRKQTLAYTMAEQQAKAASNALTSVPEFASGEELVKFIHHLLRNGDGAKFKAAMLKLLSPIFFVNGSTVQLRPDIEQAINNIITAAYNDRASYKQLYCQDPPYRVENWADGRQSVYIPAAVPNCTSLFVAGRVNAGYKDGVAQTPFRIVEFNVNVRQDDDAVNFVNSFSSRSKMCPGD